MESSLVKLKITFIIMGFVIFSYAEVCAEDWRIYAKTDSYECLYDAEDIIRSSQDIVKVWTRLEYTQKGVIEMLIKFGKHYENLSYSLELWEINCTGKKDRLLSLDEIHRRGRSPVSGSVAEHGLRGRCFCAEFFQPCAGVDLSGSNDVTPGFRSQTPGPFFLSLDQTQLPIMVGDGRIRLDDLRSSR